MASQPTAPNELPAEIRPYEGLNWPLVSLIKAGYLEEEEGYVRWGKVD